MSIYHPSGLHYIQGFLHDNSGRSHYSGDGNSFAKRHYTWMCCSDQIYLYNSKNGIICTYNPSSGVQIQLNIAQASIMDDYDGFAVDEDHFYFGYENEIVVFDRKTFKEIKTFSFEKEINAFCISQDKWWIYNDQDNNISCCRIEDDELKIVAQFASPGMGEKQLAVISDELWVTDSEENLVYIIDKYNGKELSSFLTPYIFPLNTCFYHNHFYVLYGGVTTVNTYDNESFQQQKPFLHQLKLKFSTENDLRYTLSNSFLVELIYEETIDLSDRSDVFEDVVLKLALPMESLRQKIVSISPLGLPFEIEESGNSKFAVFKLGRLDSDSYGVIGYKVILKLSGIKFHPHADPDLSMLNHLPAEIEKEKTDHEGIGIHEKFFKRFAGQCESTSVIKTVLEARNKVFESLYYKLNKSASLEDVLRDGYGTCGDYSSLIMGVCKIHGIPVRSVGGFKVTRFTNGQFEQVPNYYNHAWLEFYYPGFGWLPLESSSDDKERNGKHSMSQFLGEDWTHIRTHNNKTIPNFIQCFDGDKEVYPYDIFQNMIYEKVLGETDF